MGSTTDVMTEATNKAASPTISAETIVPVSRISGPVAHYKLAPMSTTAAYESFIDRWGVTYHRLIRYGGELPFQVNEMLATQDDCRKVEACVDAMMAGKGSLKTLTTVIQVPRPVLGRAEATMLAPRTKFGAGSFILPEKLAVRVYLMAPDNRMAQVHKWLATLQKAEAHAKNATRLFDSAAFLYQWKANGNRVREALPSMEIRGWMLTDVGAFVGLDMGMFKAMADMLGVSLGKSKS